MTLFSARAHEIVNADNRLLWRKRSGDRAFVRLRELIASNKELAQRLDDLEMRIAHKLDSHDQAITGLITTIRKLMKPPETKKRPIGFVTPQEKK